MEINHRLIAFIEWYRSNIENLADKEFCARLEMSYTQFNAIIKERDKAGLKIIEKFLFFYPPLNSNWVIAGTGKMILADNANHKLSEPETIYKNHKDIDRKVSKQLIPIYNISAAAGLVSLFNEPNQHTPVDYISLPNMGKVDGGLYAVGDSMYPLVKSGDIVVYRQIHDLLNSIFWGEMYLLSYDLEGEEYIVIKYIQKSEEPGCIRLVSQNQYHSPKDIQISNVRAIAQIKASVRFNTIRQSF